MRDQLATSASSDRSLAVIAVGGLEVATASVCATAAALARDGVQVVVVDASAQSVVSGHRLLGERESETTGGDSSGDIRVVSLADHLGAPSTAADQVVLVLAMLDPAEGAEYIRALASNAVVIVTAGRSTMTTLRAGLRHARGRAGRTPLRCPRRLQCSRRVVRSTSGRSGELSGAR